MIKELEAKEYYTLYQLVTHNLIQLKIRQAKRRLKKLAEQIKDTTLLSKDGNNWKIHKSLITKFNRHKAENKNNYQTEVTIHLLENNYDTKYYTAVAERFHAYQPVGSKLLYSVEVSDNGKPHLHIGTSVTERQARAILEKLETDFQLQLNINPDCRVAPILDYYNFFKYISKQTQPTELVRK